MSDGDTALITPWYLKDRLVLGVVLIFCATGLFAWFNLSEQEDPFFPYRNGSITVEAQGFAADAVEQIAIRPLERALATVDEVFSVDATAADGAGSLSIELDPSIYETDQAWQRVRTQIDRVRSDLSDSGIRLQLDDKAQDAAGIVVAVRSDKPLLDVRQYVRDLQDEIYRIAGVRDVSIVGDVGERIEVVYSQASMLDLGISPQSIAQHIAQANALEGMGLITSSTFQSSIQSVTRLDSLSALADIAIPTATGDTLRLGDIAHIRRAADPVATESFWVGGQQTLGISIVLPPNQVRVVDFGKRIEAFIDKANARFSDYRIEKVFFQPTWTETRRNDLAQSLVFSTLGVALSLFLLMSRRIALLVSVTVPAIALTSFAIFGMFGGVLHQMTIAGLVISLGLMVDNSIVVAELIAKGRENGLSKTQAAHHAIRELARPLATSTLTTVAAFLPMLLSRGDVADFIRMVPVMVVISIMTSYAFALIVLPTLANRLGTLHAGGTAGAFSAVGGAMSRVGTTYPRITVLCFVVLGAASVFLTPKGEGEFFPKSSRNQAYIDVEGDYGASHNATLAVVKRVESILRDTPGITRFVSFVGNSGPRFYYNLPTSPNENNTARVVFETREADQTASVVSRLNTRLDEAFTSVRVQAFEIGQGPPINSPIEIAILGNDRAALLLAAEDVFDVVNSHPQSRDTRRDYVTGKPKLAFDIDDASLARAKLTRSDLSAYSRWRTTGLTASMLPIGGQSLSISVRENIRAERANGDYVMNTVVMNTKQDMFPFSTFARQSIEADTPVRTRTNSAYTHTILSGVTEGADVSLVTNDLLATLQEIETRHGVRLEVGGESAEEDESGSALIQALPAGIIVLFGALLFQFNSLRITGVIMLTIPAALIGVRPILSLAGIEFGFMSVLGILALTGIVVNTAIILIDQIGIQVRREPTSLNTAINLAVKNRFRPIVLTTVTTVVGMIPLTLSTSPLWPPLAWTIIGGLLTSTLLTLFLLPAVLSMILKHQTLQQA